MAVVFNATKEQKHIQAHGNWFHFKPKQMKVLNDNLAMFLTTSKAEEGFVSLPEEFVDPSYKDTPEGKAIYHKAEKEGIAKFCAKLKWIVRNNTESLLRDLRQANIQTDPRELMSDGEIEALEILASYQTTGEDEVNKRVERARELEKKLNIR